jgi:class 3 adenylate cyclase
MSPAAVAGAVVFTDIVGFTEFTEACGDEEAVALLGRQERLVRSALPDGSRVVKDLGDGLLLWFDDAAEAVGTCLDLQERFESDPADALSPLWVRIGLHWGSPVPRGDDLVGHDVNVAARIVDVAGPGEVLVSDAARTKAECSELSFDEVGPVVMKGIADPMRLFRARREDQMLAGSSRAMFSKKK